MINPYYTKLLLTSIAILGSCAIPGTGVTHSGSEPVDFSNIRFWLGPSNASGDQSQVTLCCHVEYENLAPTPLKSIFLPRFSIIDSQERIFTANELSGLGEGDLNPGIRRSVDLEFLLPTAALSMSPRLRVLCPDYARAGFMMREANLMGYYFYFALSPNREVAAMQLEPSEPVHTTAEGLDSGLQNGMNLDQIVQLWGEPTNTTTIGTVQSLGYSRNGEVVALTLKSGRLTGYRPSFRPPADRQSASDRSLPLRNGMTQEEVWANWGLPDNSTNMGSIHSWAYTDRGTLTILQFRSGRLVNYSPPR